MNEHQIRYLEQDIEKAQRKLVAAERAGRQRQITRLTRAIACYRKQLIFQQAITDIPSVHVNSVRRHMMWHKIDGDQDAESVAAYIDSLSDDELLSIRNVGKKGALRLRAWAVKRARERR